MKLLAQRPLGWMRKRRAARGQALVEFAIVIPIFLSLMFGLVELSLVYGAAALYNNAADLAARSASIAEASSSTSDAQAVATILHIVHPYFMAQIVQIAIYQSDALGSGPQTATENLFDGTGTAILPQNWPIANRISTVDAPLYIGVRITYRYTWLTSFIGATGTTLILQATSIMPIAPIGG